MENNAWTQEAASTLYVETNGINFAYRSFGAPLGIPLIFFQHFIGNIDDWDPAITNEIAKTRKVILFNNTGVGSTTGNTPASVAQMARDAVSFIRALNIDKADFLGYSLGGFIAQQIAITDPSLIRKMILVGTAPQGSFSTFLDFVEKMKAKEGPERFLFIFFTATDYSRSKGVRALQRIYAPDNRRDSPVSNETMLAQADAIHNWGTAAPSINLDGIKQPCLIINGSNDHMLLTINSHKLFEGIPGAMLSLYPDSSHGALFQYPELFVEQCIYFLSRDL
jgi:pimeloyl-ACP methyl ester carboxylesterase